MTNEQHPLYGIWQSMKTRCFNPNRNDYHRYGGRGITVCESWRTNFKQFVADMGPRPEGHTLDRIDNNGHYCPENCQWSTYHFQNRNRRDTRFLTFQGKTQCIVDWSKDLNIKDSTIRDRLRRGWPVERALATI
jgi:hypothetical protein